jgi:hypothetical protein
MLRAIDGRAIEFLALILASRAIEFKAVGDPEISDDNIEDGDFEILPDTGDA